MLDKANKNERVKCSVLALLKALDMIHAFRFINEIFYLLFHKLSKNIRLKSFKTLQKDALRSFKTQALRENIMFFALKNLWIVS